MLSHGKLYLSFFFMAGPKRVWICCTDQWPKSPRKIICHGFWRIGFVYLQAHLLMQAIATANKQLLSVVMWNHGLTSSWSNHCRMLVASREDNYWVVVLAFNLTVPSVSVYGPDHHFRGQWLGVD